MRLLLTVTRPDEVATALDAGADLVDVKDPSRGALEAPGREALAEVADRLAGRAPLGVPLGDGPHRTDTLARRVETAVALGASYLKVGLLERPDRTRPEGASSGTGPRRADAAVTVATARRALRRAGGDATLVAVTFADALAGSAPGPEALVELAAARGADGVMLDTLGKAGGSLLECLDPRRLERWCRAARARDLVTALAGGLDAASVGRLVRADPDVVGVRGGACAGGRDGRLEPGRCRALRRAVDRGREVSRASAGAPPPDASRQPSRPSSSAEGGRDDGR